MKSTALTVDDYIAEVPGKRIVAIGKLRSLFKEVLTDHSETMTYSMPSYELNGQVEAAFASQKQHICIYFLKHEVMLQNSNKLEGLNHGKGCIRYPNPEKIDYDLIAELLLHTRKSDAKIC